MMSAASSGGVRSSDSRSAFTMLPIGSCSASRISTLETRRVRGMPRTRSRPLISMSISSVSGNAEPISILMRSAVCSPMSML